MATHDYIIANASGAAVRSDLNNALAAIVSQNSSSTEPSTTYAYQLWADTANGVLKIRNAANSFRAVPILLNKKYMNFGVSLVQTGSQIQSEMIPSLEQNSTISTQEESKRREDL